MEMKINGLAKQWIWKQVNENGVDMYLSETLKNEKENEKEKTEWIKQRQLLLLLDDGSCPSM